MKPVAVFTRSSSSSGSNSSSDISFTLLDCDVWSETVIVVGIGTEACQCDFYGPVLFFSALFALLCVMSTAEEAKPLACAFVVPAWCNTLREKRHSCCVSFVAYE